MSDRDFKEKFVGYIDILGFKSLVDAAEAGNGMSVQALTKLIECLGRPEDRNRYVRSGPHLCPQAARIQQDLDFQVTQVSDCAVVSAEISPAGVINLVGHCWVAALELLLRGVMCRGYITRGRIYHTERHLVGPAYIEAYSKESQVSAFRVDADERGTPFVEVDEAVCSYVQESGDSCVKEMFSRQVESDGSVTAPFPFKRLSHTFMLHPFFPFDPSKEKQAVQNVRANLAKVKAEIDRFVDQSNPSAVMKARHYIAALDRQLQVCDRTDEIIDFLAGK